MRIRVVYPVLHPFSLFDFGAQTLIKTVWHCKVSRELQPLYSVSRLEASLRRGSLFLWGETRYGVIAAEPPVEFGNKMVMSLAVKRSVALVMGATATEDKGENGFGMIEIHASCSRTLRLFVTY